MSCSAAGETGAPDNRGAILKRFAPVIAAPPASLTLMPYGPRHP